MPNQTDSTSPVDVLHAFIKATAKTTPKGQRCNGATKVLEALVATARWRRTDWAEVVKAYGGSFRRLFGDHVLISAADPEGWYRLMVLHENAGACASFEAWAGRPAYKTVEGQRLAVGSGVVYEGRELRVTSFRDGYLVAVPAGGAKGVVRLTPEQVGAADWSPQHGRGAACRVLR